MLCTATSRYAIAIGIPLAILLGWQTWRVSIVQAELSNERFYLDRTMKERDSLQIELRDMTYKAHPFVKTAKVGPTASKEMQCMELLGMVQTLPTVPKE